MHSILNRVHAAARQLRPLRCSFCGRGEREVERLVAGPAVHICDACIIKCLDILQQHGGLERPTQGPAPAP